MTINPRIKEQLPIDRLSHSVYEQFMGELIKNSISESAGCDNILLINKQSVEFQLSSFWSTWNMDSFNKLYNINS